MSNMDRWSGKVAVLTEAGSGIGVSLGVRLASLGIVVIGMTRKLDLVTSVASKALDLGIIHPKKVDISNSKEIREAFEWVDEKFGGADILINNADYLPIGHITDGGDKSLDDSEIELTLDVNIKAIILCTRLAVSSMKRRNVAGHIININSMFGHYVPQMVTTSIYPVTKHAITAFTAALINELAELKSEIKVTVYELGNQSVR